MPVNTENYVAIRAELKNSATLIAVSKTQSTENILELYRLGQRDFGENYVQEIEQKFTSLPKDISWHFIGHLQSNKVKYIAPFVSLIQSVDSLKLLQEINKQAEKNQRKINCLLQVHIAMEESKFGMDESEVLTIISKSDSFSYINITGLMGMASFTSETEKVRKEFKTLKQLFDKAQSVNNGKGNLTTLSMGMSGDYKIAAEEGSNMVRIGSLIFGERAKAYNTSP